MTVKLVKNDMVKYSSLISLGMIDLNILIVIFEL